MDPSRLQQFLFKKLTAEQKDSLIGEITEEEVKRVVFHMPNNKEPGPDGFTAEFFRENWEVVGKEVVDALKYCYDSEYIYYPMNSTLITLVPKVANADMMKDFRPIACCNFVYKCFSSILTGRIKKVISSLISTCQNAFVPGRKITENILPMHEIIKGYHKGQGKARSVMKIDIKKAYDTVSSDFLL